MLLAYVLSFDNIGIYWNNPDAGRGVPRLRHGAVANHHLLFRLSLIAAVRTWMSENHFPAIPVTASGMVLAASLCYSILQAALLRIEAGSSALATAIGTTSREGLRLDVCLGIGLSFADRWLGIVVYVAVAVMWFIPDPRIETHAYRSALH